MCKYMITSLSHEIGPDVGVAVWCISLFHIKVNYSTNKYGYCILSTFTFSRNLKKIVQHLSVQYYNYSDQRRYLLYINWPIFMRSYIIYTQTIVGLHNKEHNTRHDSGQEI